MARDSHSLHRLGELWNALDEARIPNFAFLDPQNYWPWEATLPEIRAAWEALAQPENLDDLEAWLAYWQSAGAGMEEWAREVTMKAIEVCRTKIANRAADIQVNPPAADPDSTSESN